MQLGRVHGASLILDMRLKKPEKLAPKNLIITEHITGFIGASYVYALLRNLVESVLSVETVTQSFWTLIIFITMAHNIGGKHRGIIS